MSAKQTNGKSFRNVARFDHVGNAAAYLADTASEPVYVDTRSMDFGVKLPTPPPDVAALFLRLSSRKKSPKKPLGDSSPMVPDQRTSEATTASIALPSRPVDRVFGAGDLPPTEWFFAQPLLAEPADSRRRHLANESYEERVARGAA